MPAQSLSKTHIFSVGPFTVFLHLGTVDNTSALYLGAISNRDVNKKHKNAKKHGTKLPVEGTLFTVQELKQEDRALPCSNSAGSTCVGRLTFLPFCTCIQMMAKAR